MKKAAIMKKQAATNAAAKKKEVPSEMEAPQGKKAVMKKAVMQQAGRAPFEECDALLHKIFEMDEQFINAQRDQAYDCKGDPAK